MMHITSIAFSFLPLLPMASKIPRKWLESSPGYVVSDVSGSVTNVHMQLHGRLCLQHWQC